VKPFPDISLYQFIDRKKVAKKGKQIQERLENSIFAFESVMLSMYNVVLPICDTCKSNGAKTVVGRHTHNGKAIQERMDQARRREALVASS